MTRTGRGIEVDEAEMDAAGEETPLGRFAGGGGIAADKDGDEDEAADEDADAEDPPSLLPSSGITPNFRFTPFTTFTPRWFNIASRRACKRAIMSTRDEDGDDEPGKAGKLPPAPPPPPLLESSSISM